ncbi:MAG: helix-turn-helix domain-containing protein [Anaerovibrio sp.]|uniref:helix-turn-helix domain-containing protein n=1 Tax=Anaerovibrio sp. TaxID=1872532 RepID=UPI0025DE5C2A|nr:helix-turn-helix transcriptional regulator [Anaerovibrio sp.]MCR5176829.1 helix-turn-helix domain-containing protein [Anaerovibrio sp.]
MEQINLGWLRQARREKHLSLNDVGKAVGRGPTAVWRWENGKSHIKMDMLLKLAHLYEVSIADLIMVKGEHG